MKVPKKILLTVMLTLIFSVCLTVGSIAYSAEQICLEDARLKECFKEHFHEVAVTDLDLFEKLLHQAHEGMLACRVENVGYFLDLSLSRPIGTEHAEFFSEEIEKMIVNKPECFLKGLKTLNSSSQAKIWEELENPLIEDKETLKKSLAPYKNNPEYTDVLIPYWK